MQTYHELKPVSLGSYHRLSHPETESLSLDSPASDIVTRFDHTRPFALELDVGIGDVLKTLQDVGSQHMLVVKPDESLICGIISASDIARKLHIPVAITERATSFREVVDVLYGRNGAA